MSCREKDHLMRTWNPSATPVLTGSKIQDWKALNDHFFASLVVSDERAAEIMERYAEGEMSGRPGVFASPEKKLRASNSKKIRNVAAKREQSGNDFTEEEVALADEVELVGAAD
jgi:hypothetical protein